MRASRARTRQPRSPRVVDEPLPNELATAAMRVDELVRHFEEYPDPLVREPAIELLQRIDALHRAGLRRVAELVRASGLERRALDDPEVLLLYTLYDLFEVDKTPIEPSLPVRGGATFVPLSNLLGGPESRA
jgi:hypothetical protein